MSNADKFPLLATISSPAELRALVDEIHALRTPPLLVAVDQEGLHEARAEATVSEVPIGEDLAVQRDRAD